MSSSRRRAVLEAIIARLQTIVVGAVSPLGQTFETDAGQAIYQGEVPQLGESDPDQAIAVMPRVDDPQPIGRIGFQVSLPVDIHAVVKIDVEDDDHWTVAEQVVADIKRAIETDDQTFEGLVQDLNREGVAIQAREPGSTVIAVTVTYRLTFREAWGCP